MRITDVSKVREIVERLKTDDADQRAGNRSKINDLFNGVQPYTDQEAEENHIFTNVQPLMAPRIAHEARRQLAQATMRTSRYFSVSIDTKDKDIAEMASATVTQKINRTLKASMPFYEVLRGADATVVLHGRGPSIWDDPYAWCPKLLNIEDLKVPTNTYIDLSNVWYFAVHQQLSAAELLRHIKRERVDPGWNVPAVKRMVARLSGEPFETVTDADYDFPEKLQEQFKQNGLYYGSDVLPTAKLWYFYQLTDDKDELRWELSIIEDTPSDSEARGKKAEYLYQQKGHFADSVEKIIHIQYADGANVAPFKYHSVRGMGFLLYPVLTLLNRVFCRQMDSAFEAMNQLFRNVGEQDREKLAMVMLANMSCIPQGVEYVTANERYTVNHNLVNATNATLRQFINENSASFVQDPDAGTRKEMTATQVMAQVQQAGVLLTSLVQMQGVYRQQQYREICRRFCLPNSADKDVKAFQEYIRKQGLPQDILDFERWDILPERTIGGGNKVLEMSQVMELMKAMPLFNPEAQKLILRDFALATTDDSDKTRKLVPDEPKPPSGTATFATLAFGTLCQGAPVIIPPGTNLMEYAGILTGMITARVQTLAKVGQGVSPDTAIGLAGAIQHVQTVLQQLGQAKDVHGQRVQMMAQALAQAMQMLQALAQARPQAEVPPETQGKIVSMQTLAESKARISEANAAQKLQQRDAAHQQRLAQEQVKTQADIESQDYKTAAEIARTRAQSNAEAAQKAKQEKETEE